MIAAGALRKETAFDQQPPAPSRGEALARYHRLREIGKRHHSNVMDFLSKDAILRHARRLGLAEGKALVLDRMDELNLAVDLAIYTAPPAARGQSTATPVQRDSLRRPKRR